MALTPSGYKETDEIIVETFQTPTGNVTAGTNGHFSKTITKTGYTPIGIVGFVGHGNTGLVTTEYRVYYSGSNYIADIVAYNTKNATISNVYYDVNVLYKKN